MERTPNLKERKQLILAMETVVRSINEEGISDGWLMCGVADGDLNDDSTWEDVDDFYVEDDENFADIMSCFVRTMRRMVDSDEEFDEEDRKKGNYYLYCDRVTSKYKE